jgi:hypothetical protein
MTDALFALAFAGSGDLRTEPSQDPMIRDLFGTTRTSLGPREDDLRTSTGREVERTDPP